MCIGSNRHRKFLHPPSTPVGGAYRIARTAKPLKLATLCTDTATFAGKKSECVPSSLHALTCPTHRELGESGQGLGFQASAPLQAPHLQNGASGRPATKAKQQMFWSMGQGLGVQVRVWAAPGATPSERCANGAGAGSAARGALAS